MSSTGIPLPPTSLSSTETAEVQQVLMRGQVGTDTVSDMQPPDLPPNANEGSATVATATAASPPHFRHYPEVCDDVPARPPLPANAMTAEEEEESNKKGGMKSSTAAAPGPPAAAPGPPATAPGPPAAAPGPPGRHESELLSNFGPSGIATAAPGAATAASTDALTPNNNDVNAGTNERGVLTLNEANAATHVSSTTGSGINFFPVEATLVPDEGAGDEEDPVDEPPLYIAEPAPSAWVVMWAGHRGIIIAGFMAAFFIVISLIVAVTVIVTQNANDGGSDVDAPSSTTANPAAPPPSSETSTSSPLVFPTKDPTRIPTVSTTNSPTVSPIVLLTKKPTTSPTSSPTTLPTVIPTELPSKSPTDCEWVSLEKVLLAESCGGCDAFATVDGTSAITTADNNVRFYDLTDGSWTQTQLVTVGTSTRLVPKISGNVAVIGAYTENSRTGAAYIYERDLVTNMWKLATRLAPDDLQSGAWFGDSVAVNGDIVVVGAWRDRGGGSAYIYRRDWSVGGGWSQEAKLAPEDANLDRFGVSVDVKGNTVAVGDYRYGSSNEGSVFVYTYDTQKSNWNQFQENIRNDDCDKWFGDVVLTADGELFVGCYGEDSDAGAVYHYAPSSDGGLFEMRQKITASDRSANDLFGDLRQLTVDGNVMVVGADGSGDGQVYIYARDSPSYSWMEVTQILAPNGEAKFGYTVSLSGNKLLLGAYKNAYAYVLRKCSDSTS